MVTKIKILGLTERVLALSVIWPLPALNPSFHQQTLELLGRTHGGRPFAYAVTGDFADNNVNNSGGCVSTSPTTSIALCSVGQICVKDSTGAGTCNVGTNIPAAIVSYGDNGGITPTSSLDELENWPPFNVNFVSTGYRQNPVNEFDDLVAWISPHILKNRMVAAGRLP